MFCDSHQKCGRHRPCEDLEPREAQHLEASPQDVAAEAVVAPVSHYEEQLPSGNKLFLVKSGFRMM